MDSTTHSEAASSGEKLPEINTMPPAGMMVESSMPMLYFTDWEGAGISQIVAAWQERIYLEPTIDTETQQGLIEKGKCITWEVEVVNPNRFADPTLEFKTLAEVVDCIQASDKEIKLEIHLDGSGNVPTSAAAISADTETNAITVKLFINHHLSNGRGYTPPTSTSILLLLRHDQNFAKLLTLAGEIKVCLIDTDPDNSFPLYLLKNPDLVFNRSISDRLNKLVLVHSVLDHCSGFGNLTPDLYGFYTEIVPYLNWIFDPHWTNKRPQNEEGLIKELQRIFPEALNQLTTPNKNPINQHAQLVIQSCLQNLETYFRSREPNPEISSASPQNHFEILTYKGRELKPSQTTTNKVYVISGDAEPDAGMKLAGPRYQAMALIKVSDYRDRLAVRTGQSKGKPIELLEGFRYTINLSDTIPKALREFIFYSLNKLDKLRKNAKNIYHDGTDTILNGDTTKGNRFRDKAPTEIDPLTIYNIIDSILNDPWYGNHLTQTEIPETPLTTEWSQKNQQVGKATTKMRDQLKKDMEKDLQTSAFIRLMNDILFEKPREPVSTNELAEAKFSDAKYTLLATIPLKQTENENATPSTTLTQIDYFDPLKEDSKVKQELNPTHRNTPEGQSTEDTISTNQARIKSGIIHSSTPIDGIPVNPLEGYCKYSIENGYIVFPPEADYPDRIIVIHESDFKLDTSKSPKLADQRLILLRENPDFKPSYLDLEEEIRTP